MTGSTHSLEGDSPIRGTVYGSLLNDRRTVDRLRPQFDSAPYKAAPAGPILYIKPRNTLVSDGAAVVLPHDAPSVRVDATVGAVIGRLASRVTVADALDFVSGYVIVSDLTLPHEVYYRPSIKHRCRDGFCPLGPVVAARRFDAAVAEVTVSVNGKVRMREGFGSMVRQLPQLLADVTDFMTLEPGDVLLMGLQDTSPMANIGDTIRIEVSGLGALEHSLVAPATTDEAA